jgi:hypothetical protein
VVLDVNPSSDSITNGLLDTTVEVRKEINNSIARSTSPRGKAKAGPLQSAALLNRLKHSPLL